ncbi:MAG: hypothetical protein ACOCX5_02960 [Chloroflexota bacterium]
MSSETQGSNQQKANQNNQQTSSNPTQQSNPFQRRFEANNSNNNQQTNGPSGSLLNRVRSNNSYVSLVPVTRAVVQFSLRGLGDPFYRILGEAINTTYANASALMQALEAGGDLVDRLEIELERSWSHYNFQGAAMVYPYDLNLWEEARLTNLMPGESNRIFEQMDNSDSESEDTIKPTYQMIRALDLSLVLNVLARARTQFVLASAPLIFSRQYLARVLIADDSRLVDLVRATGYIDETTIDNT